MLTSIALKNAVISSLGLNKKKPAGGGKCVIDKTRRNWCSYCRLQQCLAANMNIAGNSSHNNLLSPFLSIKTSFCVCIFSFFAFISLSFFLFIQLSSISLFLSAIGVPFGVPVSLFLRQISDLVSFYDSVLFPRKQLFKRSAVLASKKPPILQWPT